MIIAALALVLLGQGPAQDEVVDLDTERVRPTFGADAFLTHPGTRLGRPRLDLGAVLQLEHAPLVQLGGDGGTPVVSLRWSLAAGLVWIPIPRLALVGTTALHLSTGELPPEVPSFALGDASVGASWQLIELGPLATTVGGELWVPMSTAGALVGDKWRGGPHLSVGLHLGPLELLLAVDVLIRPTVDTGHGLVVGPELSLTAAAASSWRQHRVFVELRSTTALVEDGGGAEPIDLRVGTRLHGGPGDSTLIAVGVGLNDGYGASTFRVLVGLDFSILDGPKDPDPPQVELPTEVRPRARPLAFDEVVVAPIIVPETPADPHSLCPRLGPPIGFAVGSAQLTDASRAQLDEIAVRIRQQPAIAHAIIDGHASPEGTGRANWALSTARAQAVLTYLLSIGVSIHRLSIRGWGESYSADAPRIEDDRRVQLCVIRALDMLEDMPDWSAERAGAPWVWP